MLTSLLHKIALTCNEATLLLEREGSNEISLLLKNRLNFHLKICKSCRSYKRKAKIIDKILIQEDFLQQTDNLEGQEQIEKLKEKINQRLR